MMQAPSGSQRIQRRSPVADTNPSFVPQPTAPPSIPTQMASVQTPSTSGTRSSSGSGKGPSSTKRRDASQQLSQIEKSVTHLLIATKQLLETLTQWSRHTATEGEVSDVYVRLGYEFNIACRAFTSIGVDTTDLGPVPDLLRVILEETLSQEASPASLDKFLPKIRDIIINLLHGLKRKQQRLRARQAKENPQNGAQTSRQLSVGSTGSGDTGLTQMLEEVPQTKTPGRPPRRTGSGGTTLVDDTESIPARSSSMQNLTPIRNDSVPAPQETPTRSGLRERRLPPPSLSDSSMSSETAQNLPILSPDDHKLPIQGFSMQDDDGSPYGPPPPPPPKQDAFAALQRGGELERRASRRYSAYQISKLVGSSPGGIPMIPPPQNSPVPNRGRDVRESLNAVRTRGSLLPGRQRSMRFKDGSPSRGTQVARRISEEHGGQSDDSLQPANQTRVNGTPQTRTNKDKSALSQVANIEPDHATASATSFSQAVDELIEPPEQESRKNPGMGITDESHLRGATQQDTTTNEHFIPEQSPQPGKELTLFLQYKSRIKKIVLADGSSDLTMARLQLAFIEKFAWNTHSNGIDLPEIYIQDSISGVRHELEDLSDVKDRSVLVLNVEVLDEVKRHFDESFSGLQKVMEGVRTAVDGTQMYISQVAAPQRAAAEAMARTISAPPIPPRSGPVGFQVNGIKPDSNSDDSIAEVQTLRRDLAVLRQTFTTFTSGVNSSMAEIRTKASTVKAKAVDAAIPVLQGDSGRAYVEAGKKTVGDDSETIVNRVDDLQDLIEDLRKDVVTRGVRPLPRQLETVGKDISEATKELNKMKEYVKREKPVWTKIWEKELETVCNEREFLTMQEELITDLQDDLEKANETFALVEEATKQQNLQVDQGQPVVTLRSTSRGLSHFDGSNVDPMKAKDGVLGEVRALQPNHETRLEAIERAEKARQRELENRREGAAFKRELGNFVEEGKLKKSGGFEEAERLRTARDERNRKEEWETQQARKAARAKARAEEAAKMPPQNPEGQGGEGDDEENDELNGLANSPGDEDGNDEERKEAQISELEGDPQQHPTESPNKRTSWLPSIFTS